jgi:hypothetical protein
MSVQRSLATLILSLLPAGLVLAADQPRALTPEEVKKLVDQLGTADAEVAKKLQAQLIELGPQALPPLRAAAFTSSAEPARRRAGDLIERIARDAQKKLEGRLAKINAKGAVVYRLTDDSLARVFPAYLVFAVRFPMYPVAVRPKAPLKAQNLFIMDKEGQMDHVTNMKELRTFCIDHILGKVLKGSEAKNPARACLAMAQELVQDGYFKFSVPDEAVKIGQAATGVRVTARSLITPEKGNKGFIQIQLDFGLTGDLEALAMERTITTGQRPK